MLLVVSCAATHARFFVVLQFKLCRVVAKRMTPRGIPVLTTHDGRTLRYPDPLIKTLDTVKLDLTTGKIVDFAHFATGNVCMITKGRNSGRVGIIVHRDRHPGSFDIVHIRDASNQTFATRLENVFVIGKGETPWVTLPKGNGVKRPIVNVK